MTMTITAVKRTPNWICYRCSHDGAGGDSANITSTGAATPDLQTDSKAGPINAMSKVVANGYGQFAAGVQTQAKARALWLSDWSGADPGNENTTTARCRIRPRAGVGGNWTVEANVDGGGNPILTVSETQLAGARVAYLDVEVPQAIGIGPAALQADGSSAQF